MDDYNKELNRLKKQAEMVSALVYSDARNELIINVLLDLVEILCRQHEGVDTVSIATDIVTIIEKRKEQ